MKHIATVLGFFISLSSVNSQCLDAPILKFKGAKVEWAISAKDTFVTDDCYKYISYKEVFPYYTEPLAIGSKVVWALPNFYYGTVVQCINHENGNLDWTNYYNSKTENGYGRNYYLGSVSNSEYSITLNGTSYPVSVPSNTFTQASGFLTSKKINLLTGKTLDNVVFDNTFIFNSVSNLFHTHNGKHYFYEALYLPTNFYLPYDFRHQLYEADYTTKEVKLIGADTVFFNSKDDNGYINGCTTKGPLVFSDSTYAYVTQFRKNGTMQLYFWKVDAVGNILQYTDISETFKNTSHTTIFVNVIQSGEEIILITKSFDDSYEGNYGYVILSNTGKLVKNNIAISINNQKLGFMTLKQLSNGEMLIATRPQDQNDIYFYKEKKDGQYVQAAHLINPNRSVYALSPEHLLQTNDNGIVLSGKFIIDSLNTMIGEEVKPFDFGGWPVIMKLSAETLGITSATDVDHDLVSFSISPNPSTQLITVTTSDQPSAASVIITDQVGKVVYQHAFNTQSIELDISHITSGMYFVSLIDANGKQISTTQKLVKM